MNMDVQFGPNSADEPNLLYKLQRKIKVFNTSNTLPNRGYNLVSSSTKYGIVFIGSPTGTLSAYYLKELIDKESEPRHMTVKIPEKPTHVAVSCDQEFLAVTGGQLLCIYKVTDFQNQNISPALSIKLDVSTSTFVSALQWNPCIPDTIAIAYFDGILLVAQVSNGQVKKAQSKARCICWSPKGKQLVTGNSDGTLSQYKPDLTLAKNVPAPNLFEGAPVEALAIYWISTFQFAVVYKNATDNSRPAVTIINTPKAGQPSCINYEDICYSMGSNRPWYYYLYGLPQWNLILSSSSNSIEIASLGSTDGASWVQWCQPDEARPELPLTDKKQENYPVGLCIDTCAVHQLPWGENESLPYMPLLLVVSQTGLLTIFNVINFNKQAPQLCTPPQQIALPAGALTSDVPDDVVHAPAPAIPIQPVQPVAQSVPQPVLSVPQPVLSVPQPVLSVPQPVLSVPQPSFPKPQTIAQPNQTSQGLSFGARPYSMPQPQALIPKSQQQTDPKPKIVETKPAPTAISQPQQLQSKSTPPTQVPKSQPTPEMNAAVKAEQEKVNKLKADQELRNMLVKEVNDFQMELYRFMVKSRQTQIKLQQDLDSINSNFNFQSLDTEQLKKDCDLEQLRNTIVHLKLELVRAYAIVAEARTHSEAQDLDQWTQTDPLTTKRVESVKKLAYYVQNQLEQAHKALNYKWNEIAARDLQYSKPGQRMIRPILDDVYQPLVKQQEILSRQQAVLRTLKNTLKECDATPMFKSTSLLRSTPFRNKDPLSKLTKNILNMSIEPEKTQPKDSFLSPQKLDALRDMLSNHKPVKIKPVNVELRQKLAAMRLNYEKSVKEKAQALAAEETQKPQAQVPSTVEKIQPAPPMPSLQPVQQAPTSFIKPDIKQNKIGQPLPINVPAFTPVNTAKPTPSIPGLQTVSRTLFADEPKVESPKPVPQLQSLQQFAKAPLPSFGSFSDFTNPASANTTVSPNTRSVLKDMLQNKQANQAKQEDKNDANTFMGQKICSPLSFSPAQPVSTQPPVASFISKPISNIDTMFQKFTPQAFVPEAKPQANISKAKSDETGEPDAEVSKPIQIKKKEEKPLTNLFAMKPTSPLTSSSQNVPDVLKTSPASLIVKTDKSVSRPTEKAVEKSKENVPEKSSENIHRNADGDKKENIVKSVKSSVLGSASPIVLNPSTTSGEPQKTTEIKSKDDNVTVSESTSKLIEVSVTSSAASIFAAANATTPTATKQQPSLETPSTSPTQSPVLSLPQSPQQSTPTTVSPTKEPALSTTKTTSASSLFGTAASQAFVKTTQAGSIFSSSGSQGSIFGTATSTTTTASLLFGTSTTQSAFSSPAESKPTVFSTPTPASAASIFGAAAAAATTTQSSFGSPTGSLFATTTASSAFGSGSIFGTSTSQPGFGTATTTAPSVFGAGSTSPSIFATTTSTPLFGNTTTTTQSLFGTATTTTQATIFGSPSTQASIFGSTTPTTQSSAVFGSTPQTSVFGTTTPSTQASVFGTPPKNQVSVFGSPQTTQASVFGAPTTTASGSLFGDANNLFAAASISTTNASSPSSGGNIFGGGSPGSVFGSSSSTNVFGGKAFNQSNPSAAAIFGGGASFGQKPSTNFWAGGSNTATSGGFGSSTFGQQATTQSSSIFGASTGGSFSSPSGGQPFGSPQQTSVFGSPQQQQSAPAFGGSTVFGAKPAFGQSASFGSPTGGSGFGSFSAFNKSPTSGFGSSATFGGGATFGGTAFGSTSPGKVFGGSAPTPAFATSTQSNSTFESLATQNTLTFGNLAQQSSPQAQPAAPAFGNSPSFTGWRG